MFQTVVSSAEQIREWLKNTIPMIDFSRSYVVTIKQFRKKRSVDQNSVYWMWMTALANHIGDTKEDVHRDLAEALGELSKDTLHEAYKRKFLPWNEVYLPAGLSYYEPGHTPDTDTGEFSEYMGKVHVHAMQFFGMHLPYPDDPSFPEFKEMYSIIG